MKKKVRYIEEIYTDKYRTLQQAIFWDIELDKESNGMESTFAKSRINPNLTILLEKRYLDKNCKIVNREIIGEENEL